MAIYENMRNNILFQAKLKLHLELEKALATYLQMGKLFQIANAFQMIEKTSSDSHSAIFFSFCFCQAHNCTLCLIKACFIVKKRYVPNIYIFDLLVETMSFPCFQS